jgi:Protein phosphatase 2C
MKFQPWKSYVYVLHGLNMSVRCHPCIQCLSVVAGPQQWAGCTALVSLVYGNHLYVANAGDCRAVLCRNGEAVRIALNSQCPQHDIQAAAKHPPIDRGHQIQAELPECGRHTECVSV